MLAAGSDRHPPRLGEGGGVSRLGVSPYHHIVFLFFLFFHGAGMYDNYRHYVMTRILEKSIHRDTGCIEYSNVKHKYGLVSITFDGKRKSVPAHRALYMAVNDCLDLSSSVHIRHKCDNPRCVNIEHLIAGTPKQNMGDCIERGRRATKYRPHIRQRDHDNDKILAIRAATGKHKWIAEEFGCSVGYVSKIKSGKAKALIYGTEPLA